MRVPSGLVPAVPVLQDFVDRHRHPAHQSSDIGVPAHVTALYPWVRRPLTDDVLDECGRVVQDFGPLSMSFRRVATFPSGSSTSSPNPTRACARSPRCWSRRTRLPLAAGTVDAAMAVLTVHHWADMRWGLAELVRVARRRVVLVTIDPEVGAHM